MSNPAYPPNRKYQSINTVYKWIITDNTKKSINDDILITGKCNTAKISGTFFNEIQKLHGETGIKELLYMAYLNSMNKTL
jgi:hypothetical protein